MLENIKRLGTETAVYGISTIVGRFLNFLLVPFYTNVLAPGEYGVVTYLFSLIAFMNVIYGYGMESAYLRYSSTNEIGTKEQNFSTPFLSLFFTSALLSSLLLLGSHSIADFLELAPSHAPLIHYASWILFFDTLAIVPFASLRMERKATLFAGIKLINIVINVGANVILLLVYRTGVEGIFISNLLASAVTLFLLAPTVQRHFTTDFSKELYRALLRFGFPYVPAGIAAMMIQVVDRPILRMLTDDATVGIYQANYRLGVFMMLVVQMFDYAWRPFFLNHAREPNAREMFARILTYFVLLMSVVFLLLTLFLPDVVRISMFGRHLIHPAYWSALGIVPIVLGGYVFLGIATNMIAGVYIEKKTHYLPFITFVGAAVNVGGNLLLIPQLGLYGAAWATFLSYFVMAVVQYVMVQRIYPIQYEWKRLAKIAMSCTIILVLYYVVPVDEMKLVWKVGLLGMFCAAVYFTRFLNKEELVFVKRLFSQSAPRETQSTFNASSSEPPSTRV